MPSSTESNPASDGFLVVCLDLYIVRVLRYRPG